MTYEDYEREIGSFLGSEECREAWDDYVARGGVQEPEAFGGSPEFHDAFLEFSGLTLEDIPRPEAHLLRIQ